MASVDIAESAPFKPTVESVSVTLQTDRSLCSMAPDDVVAGN
jgi:hypothetical protein